MSLGLTVKDGDLRVPCGLIGCIPTGGLEVTGGSSGSIGRILGAGLGSLENDPWPGLADPGPLGEGTSRLG